MGGGIAKGGRAIASSSVVETAPATQLDWPSSGAFTPINRKICCVLLVISVCRTILKSFSLPNKN